MPPKVPQKDPAKTKRRNPAKLGYMQERELKDLPQKIDALESKQKELYETMSDPLFYKKDKEEVARVKLHLDRVENEIAGAYLRWEELEEMGEPGDNP